MTALHDYVLAQLSQAQVRSAREAKRLGADRADLAAAMFGVLVDMLVANVLAAAQGKTANIRPLVESVVKRFRTVMASAEKEVAFNDPDQIIVPE